MMDKTHILQISTLCWATLLAVPASWGQVDPAWLQSWNEAQKSKPETLGAMGRIGPKDEPGTPMIIHGQVVLPDGEPAGGVVVHAYHRDHAGFEFGAHDNSTSTWDLQGWAITDETGQFEFHTIRPATDHMGREAAHIHFTLVSEEHGRQWAPKVFLAEDPLVTSRDRARSRAAGKFGSVRESRIDDGVMHLDVNLRLKAQADF